MPSNGFREFIYNLITCLGEHACMPLKPDPPNFGMQSMHKFLPLKICIKYEQSPGWIILMTAV